MNKKKLSMMVATVLMAGLVAGMGAMTYSKYITSTKVEAPQVTAAKWGFVVNVNTSKLFGDAYGTDGAVATTRDNDSVTVLADTEGKYIVAPGTHGEMTIEIDGTAEVDAKIAITATSDGSTDIGIADVSYYPVRWKLVGANQTFENKTLKEVLDTLNATDTIPANTKYEKKYTLSWEWPFETGANDEAKKTNNLYDTLIGYKSFNRPWADIKSYVGDSYEEMYTTAKKISTSIGFALDISIVQVD